MLDDLTKEIKAQLYERARSPLFGAFALAWVGWNNRALMILISDLGVREKLASIDSIYKSNWDWLIWGGILPMLSAMAFILLYPYPARWVYGYWATQHKKLKLVQQAIEDETPLTQEEAKALRKASLTQQTELQMQLRELTEFNRELTQRLTQADERLATQDAEKKALVTELESFREMEKRNGADSEFKEMAVSETEMPHVINESSNALGYEKIVSLISSDTKQRLINETGNKEAMASLLALVCLGGRAKPDALSKTLKMNPVDIKHGLQTLSQREIATSSAGSWYLTVNGNALAVRLKLTADLPLLEQSE